MALTSSSEIISLIKVISGGQTGADRAALEAAEELGLKTGGVTPQHFITASGRKPELGTRFGLKDSVLISSGSFGLVKAYITRSMLNVDNSEATIAIRMKPSKGTDQTIKYCRTGKWGYKGAGTTKNSYRPYLVISDLRKPFNEQHPSVQAIIKFIQQNQVKVLNVAGHRDDQSSGVKQFQQTVKELLLVAFKQ